MGIAGIGSALSSLGPRYDFTKMTNQQLFDAARQLGSEGKLSQTEAANLSWISQGVDSVPINGPSESTQQILGDPTQHNFIQELQGDDYAANAPGSIGAALYDSLLKDLQTYQGKTTNQTSQNLSIQA